VIDEAGTMVREARVPSEPEALVAFFQGLALQLHGLSEVTLLRQGLMTSSPDGPGDDEGRLDLALG
jgi:hypothetical protein